jgi:hypothetical protein
MSDIPRTAGVAETTEAQIAVHWREEEYYDPPESFVRQANLKDPAVNDRPRKTFQSASTNMRRC